MLELFKSVPIVSDIVRSETLSEPAASYPRETLTVGWEDRMRARGRRRSDAGSEFATMLPRGTVLRGGDRLLVDELSLLVVVVEAPEAVLVVRPRTAAEWGLFGYQIGNSHQPMMIAEDAIVCAELPGMEQVLRQHNIPFTHDVRPFTPVTGMAGHGHAG